jgi:predicted MFS family arabinose efflux permease
VTGTDLSASTPGATATAPGRRRLVAALAVTQTVGYGALIQSFAVLLVPMATDLDVSRTSVTAAATISTLVGALAAYPVGAALDRYGGRVLMTAGSAVGVAGVLLWSASTDLTTLYSAFLLIGLGLALSTYEAAFAVLVAATDTAHRDTAIIVVSLVTGFATSLYYPLAGRLEVQVGWRDTLVVLAGSLALVAVPLHWWAVPGRAVHARQVTGRGGTPMREAVRRLPFWLVLASFVTQAGVTSAFLLLMVSYFRDAGHVAAVAVSLPVAVGVLQLLSRLAIAPLARRFGMGGVTAACFGIQGLGLLALPLAGTSIGWTVLCLAGFGMGYGVSVVARPSIVADTFGVARFASILALMTVPMALSRAGTPLLATAVGGDRFLVAIGAAAVCSALLLIPVVRAGGSAATRVSVGRSGAA